jgi:hypothetical protein
MIINSLGKIFKSFDSAKSVSEKYSTLDVEIKISETEKPGKKDFRELIEGIEERDRFLISITIGKHDPISLKSINSLDDFYQKLDEQWDLIEDEVITFKLEIYKSIVDGVISVYSFKNFSSFVETLDIEFFLGVLSEDLLENGFLCFSVQDGLEQKIESGNILFLPQPLYEKSEIDSKHFDKNLYRFKNEFCDYNYAYKFPFTPHTFFIQEDSEKFKNAINKRLNELVALFSISQIFNRTSLEGNKIKVRLDGYRVINFESEISKITSESAEIYFKIWKWIYSNNSNVADKIGLARNILTIYLKGNSLDIEDTVLYSIESGYKVYLQENIERYIEIRNKIGEQLIQLTDRINNSIKDFIESYQKSNLVFLSFFVSVFVIRVLNTESFIDVFTKEASILSYALLSISLIYLIFSLIRLNSEKKRAKEKYTMLKSRFSDLLIDKDIQKILRDDEEFDNEISHLKSLRWKYILLWFITIIILGVAVHLVSACENMFCI